MVKPFFIVVLLLIREKKTEKLPLSEGTYYLRMLGHLDDDAHDDTWSLATKDGVVASGGRYDRATFVVSGGAITSVTVDNVFDQPISHDISLAKFEGLMSLKDFEPVTNKMFAQLASSDLYKIFAPQQSTQSFTENLSAHPFDTFGILLATALFGMISMYGIMSLFRTSTPKKYDPVMDISQNIPPKVEIQLEQSNKREVSVCQL